MTHSKTDSRKNVDIEILRGYAILFTMILHCRVLLEQNQTLITALSYFDLSVGVDIFLVISGYVITRSILASERGFTGSKRTLIFSFWIKRVFRLLPAAWLWIVIATFVQLILANTTDLQFDLQQLFIRVAAAFGNFMNWYGPYCIDKVGVESCLRENYLGHYWSLSLEEQFYIVFPLLFLLLKRRFLVGLLVAAVLLQFMWFRPFFSYTWYFKTDALCWGVLLALYAKTLPLGPLHSGVFSKNTARVLGLLALISLPMVGAQIQGIGHHMKPFGVATVALICAVIVWMASWDLGIFNLGGRYSKIMLYLGSRSYSLYLAHLIVYFTVRDSFDQLGGDIQTPLRSIVLVCTALILTFIASELNYRYVEAKFRARGRLIAARWMST